MPKSRTMEEALNKLFDDHRGEELELEEIYRRFQDYYELSPSQRMIKNLKYHYPNFQHEIRSIIAKLVKDSIIIQVGRGCYKKP